LKLSSGSSAEGTFCRLPPGRRGLKQRYLTQKYPQGLSPSPRKAWIETWHPWRPSRIAPSPSPRKAWIETPHGRGKRTSQGGRLPPGRRGLKHLLWSPLSHAGWSPSPRKAWIETTSRRASSTNARQVAFPPEGVD